MGLVEHPPTGLDAQHEGSREGSAGLERLTVVPPTSGHAHEKDYLPVRGLPALREAIAAHVARDTGLS